MMKKIALLSCRSLEGHVVDDHMLVAELEKSFEVTTINWDDEADWSSFDCAIIRTTWDYFDRCQEFLAKMKFIATQTRLLNDFQVIEWNYHKAYLKELENKGARVVPTVMFSYPHAPELPADWNFKKFIIKPAISAGAHKTMVVSLEEIKSGSYQKSLSTGDWMLQPFLEEIKAGEISLVFFNKTFSHGILKVPKAGDFRVQEEHGGDVLVYTPSEKLLKSSHQLLASVPFDLLYARVDVIPYEGEHLLMELEMIEPALYFRTDPQSVKNFKEALEQY